LLHPLLLHCPAHRRALHSFLTRRSSDLVHTGAFDLARTGRLGRAAIVGFPALLPVGELGLGLAQRLLTELVVLLQLLQLRLGVRSEEHTSELQSRENLVCRLLLDTKK